MSNSIFYGTVVWFDPKRGYGFIEWENNGVKQKDLFAHFSDVECNGFKTLYKGQKVSFKLGSNKNGDPKAINISILRN